MNNELLNMDEKKFEQLKMQVGRNIKISRLQKNLSQKELGLIANLDGNYIGGVERGERNISLRNLFIISWSLEIPIESLFL